MIERSERLIHKFSLKCCMTDYILSYALLKIILLYEKKICRTVHIFVGLHTL